MQNQLFRKKSLEQVASPEQLDDYMRVTNPAIWMVLAAVIVLLAGLLILSAVKPLETTLSVSATAKDGEVSVVLPASAGKSVKDGMPLRLAGEEAAIGAVYKNEAGETVCTAELSVDDGVYDAQIVTDSIRPIRFLLN